MKQFYVSYDGAEFGGRAIVIAKNEDHAEALVKADRRTTNFENVKVTDHGQIKVGSVLSNWNGDPQWLKERA